MEPTLSIILISIVVAASITWAVKLLNWLWLKPRKLEKILRKQGLNGTPYRPFLGDLNEFVRITSTEQRRSIKLSDNDTSLHIFAYYHQTLTKYGKNSFMWFGPWPRLNIADPELIKEILSKPDVFQKPLPEIGKIVAGGLSFLEGEKWAKHRNIVNPVFNIDKLKNMVPLIGLSCSSMINKWQSMVSEGRCEIDVWPHLQDLTGDAISRAAFGSSEEEGRRIFELMRDKIKLALEIFQLSMIPGWRYLPTKVNREVRAMTNELQCLLRGMIDKRQKAIERGETVPTDDFLGVLLESNTKGQEQGMSMEEVIEECKMLHFSASETTSSLLVWTLVLLCQHPQWQTRARNEVNLVFGDSDPHFQGLNRLRTVTMILQEVLRLYPPAPLTIRGSTERVRLGDLIIPAGVHMTLLIGLVHRDPDLWGDDANEFKPQRFVEGASNAAKIQSAFVPFSSGPRVCLGINFAMMEAKMAIAMILRRFSFEISPSYVHAPFSVLTLTHNMVLPLSYAVSDHRIIIYSCPKLVQVFV